jgi:hypothetical protein
MSRRPWIAISLCVVLVLLFWLVPSRRDGAPPTIDASPKSGAVAAPERAAPHRAGRMPRAPAAIDPAAPTDSMQLRLVDVATGAPIANAKLRLVVGAQPEAASEATTSALGVVDCPTGKPVRVSTDGPGVGLIFPAKEYRGPTEDVLACRTAVIACDVTLADEPLARPAVRVLATPSNRAQGEFVSDPNRVGSAEWLRINRSDLSVVSVTSPATPVMLTTPIFPEVTFLASADGYLADVAALRFDGADPAPTRVKLTLRKARRVSIEVPDEDGSPVAGATFQYAVQRRGGIGMVNPAVLYPLREVIRCGFTATTSDQTQTSALNAIVNARADVNGITSVVEPMQGDRDYVMVWAEGFEPFLQRRGRASTTDETIPVVLRRRAKTCDYYRLMRKGSPMCEVTIMLAERLDDDFTPALPLYSAGKDGRLVPGLIAPGHRYLATVHEERTKHTYRGELTFGTTSDVDADGLVE